MTIAVGAEFLQRQQAQLAAKETHADLLIVVVVLTLDLHTPQTHAYPRVKLLEFPTASREVGGEVVRRAPDHSVQFLDNDRVQIVFPNGQLPDLGLELLHGVVPHASRAGR